MSVKKTKRSREDQRCTRRLVPRETYWAYFNRATSAKAELADLLQPYSFDTEEEIQEFVNGLELSDDAVLALREGCFRLNWQDIEDHSQGMSWVFYMPTTIDVKEAIYEWDQRGSPRLGRKIHIDTTAA